MKTIILCLAAIALPAGRTIAQSRIPEPVIDSAVCPFECCQLGPWRADGRVVAHTSPAAGAPVAYVIANGETVRAEHGDLRSAHPGQLVLRAPLQHPTATFHPGVNDTIVIFGCYGEGQYGYRWHDVTVGNDELWNAIGDISEVTRPTQVSPPNGTWWVAVTNSHGKSGWVNAGHLWGGGFGDGPSFHGEDSCSDRAGTSSGRGA